MKIPAEGETTKGIMMSGESPTPHTELNFDFKETTLPISTKSATDIGTQVTSQQLDETTSSGTIHQTLAAQELNHSFKIQCGSSARSTSNRRSIGNDEVIEEIEEIPLSSEVQTKSTDKIEDGINHDADKTDGGWPRAESPKPDDSCGIQCLYYTMQCCECTIL